MIAKVMNNFQGILSKALTLMIISIWSLSADGQVAASGISSDNDSYGIKILRGEKIPISPYLLGFNIVYAYEADSVWNDGKISGYLKDVSTSVMRYPGGTVSSYYHWDNLSGEGWKDSWDPVNKVVPKDKSAYMDLDEFITLARKIKITPLLGVNMSSGRRWNRLEDGVKEALALMKYCKEKKFVVKYWYLDNEPYQPDSNGGSKTIEEYAGMVNLYAIRMKEFDPEIKIIVNWHSSFEKSKAEYQKLLSIAGSNIDIIDAHWYWSWSKPTFEKWLAKTPMEVWTGGSYLDEIAYFRQMVKDFGYPNIKLASLEWNVGPIRERQLTPHQCAFIQSEMLMQFITGGLDMATFWPLEGAGEATTARSFVKRSDRAAQPAFHTFEFMGKMQGCSVLKNEIVKSNANVFSLITEDERESVIRVCLLNKNGTKAKIEIQTDLVKNSDLKEAFTFVLTKNGNDSEMQQLKMLGSNGSEISFTATEMSLTMLTFKKKKS